MTPPRPAMLDAYARHSLSWFPELGVGFYECEGAPYDGEYFARYRLMAETPMGRALTLARLQLVKRWLGDLALRSRQVLDVGIGAGAFVEACRGQGIDALGYDVNPAGVAWLDHRGLFRDLYEGSHPIVTFWDSLEHIRDLRAALARCSWWAFVALPIFTGGEQVLGSKHFRRDEHYWYFTRDGFRRLAQAEGFEVLDIVATESALGREDIETFVLRRRQ